MKIVATFEGREVPYVTLTDFYATFGSRSKFVKKIVESALKRGLIREYKRSRIRRDYFLTEKGEKLLDLVKEAYELIYGREIELGESKRKVAVAEHSESLPDFLKGNPWLSVLAKRGRE